MRAEDSPASRSRATRGRSFRWWRLAALVALGINLIVLYAPRVDGPAVPGVRLDLLGHALTFALLTFTALMAHIPPRLVVALAATNAAASEAVQHWFLPERTGDLTDLAADLVGLTMGWLAWRAVRRWSLSRGGAREPRDRGP